MKHLIILGDGMADWSVEELGGKTLLEYADTPAFDWLARNGRNGLLKTVADGFHPGSEVANSTILGYDQHIVYEGRGPLEAASIGVELAPDDFAMRCNLVCLEGDLLKNHSCGRLETEEGDVLIKYLQEHLGNERVHFYTGVQYRHLLVIKGGNKHIHCTPPHDVPLQPWRNWTPQPDILPVGKSKGGELCEDGESLSPFLLHYSAKRQSRARGTGGLSSQATVALLNDLILRSQELLAKHPLNLERQKRGMDPANCIWPWGGGYRPKMTPLTETFSSQIRQGSVITAVDLIRGIGHYAGLKVINVPGATGLYDTNYEGKAQAAIEALKTDDFVYLHIEASDEAGHDGSIQLKLQTITDLDHRLVRPILEAFTSYPANPASTYSAPLGGIEGGLSISLLPDHPTPCRLRTHTAEPIPFCIWHPGIEPDSVQTFSENAAKYGAYGNIEGDAFIRLFMQN